MYVRLKNVKRFNDSLGRIVANGRIGVQRQMEKQGKLLVGHLMDLTPPSGRHGRGVKAKQAGMRTVEAEIRKVIMGVDKRRDPNPSLAMGALRQHHEKARKGGRVKGKSRTGRQLMVTSKSKLNAYIKQRQKQVGMLAAGWNAAARRFKLSGRKWPAWVKRHNPPSFADLKMGKRKIKIRLVNQVKYAGNVGIMRRRLDAALHRSARNNEKILHSYKKAAKAEGWKVV